jgi:predicted RNase H-like nuclease (RuvC/YqgF family)
MRDAERQAEKFREDNWKLQTIIKEKEKVIENLEFKINE